MAPEENNAYRNKRIAASSSIHVAEAKKSDNFPRPHQPSGIRRFCIKALEIKAIIANLKLDHATLDICRKRTTDVTETIRRDVNPGMAGL
ncbi:hypothetical protein [Serratia marcescens]|uniref:hypothetical protein n=1 Tax=Serratia marcescens TaxID=615 RepID=UPI0034E29305